MMRAVALCVLITAPIFAQTPDFATSLRKAKAGDAKAQYDLAAAYFQGTGIPENHKEGLVWLQKSAQQGYAAAEATLGYMYQKGVDVAADPHEAAKWYRKAAAQNITKAQEHLSEMLGNGLISQQEAHWAIPAPTKEAKNTKAPPFSLAEVETGLSGGITTKRMTDLVTKYGVDFTMGPSTRKSLSEAGADDSLLNTIASSKH
jgi:TPR repeat protein